MARPKFAALQYHDQLAPIVYEMLRPLCADAACDEGLPCAFHGLELTLRQLEVPGMAIANLDLDEPGVAQCRGALIERSHVVGDAFEPEELQHLGRIGLRAAPQPIAGDEPPARPQYSMDLGKDRLLIGNLHQRILREDD